MAREPITASNLEVSCISETIIVVVTQSTAHHDRISYLVLGVDVERYNISAFTDFGFGCNARKSLNSAATIIRVQANAIHRIIVAVGIFLTSDDLVLVLPEFQAHGNKQVVVRPRIIEVDGLQT
jgi:hypothetical protein